MWVYQSALGIQMDLLIQTVVHKSASAMWVHHSALQGAPYVFERFSEAVLRPWVDVEMKSYHIFLTQVYTFQIP